MKRDFVKTVSITSIVLSVIAIVSVVFVMGREELNSEAHYKDMIKKHYQVFSPIIPNSVSFCGEKLPLDNIFVREALDRELTTIMYNHSTTFLVIKRSQRYFPEIEKVLKEEGVPEDLKYLAVAESGLANVVSPAKAEGYWQFLSPTAKEYGLEVGDYWDDRYEIKASTRAAARYLKQKYSTFNNNWALAAASYNAGEKGVRDRLREQSCDNYWEMFTNTETSRYVYRIVAYKIIMENPQNYGYYIRTKDKYPPIPTKQVKVDSTITNLYEFAKAMNVPYLYLKRLNPALRDKQLINKNNKTYIINLPDDNSLSYRFLIDDYKNERVEIIDENEI